MPSKAPNLSRFWFVHPEDVRSSPSADYHEHSKISEFHYRFGGDDPKRAAPMMRLINAVAGKSKDYGYRPRYPLEAAPWPEIAAPLGGLLERRRSRRKLAARPLDRREIATLLVRAAGVNGELATESGNRPLRAYPSGGGLYPLEIYLLVLADGGLPPGLYHYDVYGPALSLLAEGSYRDRALVGFMEDPMLRQAPAVLLVTALFLRSRFKYGERSYRFVMLEAGHLMQNLILTGQALGLSVVPIGGFLDRYFERMLDLDGFEESVIYSAILGRPEAD
jgi:SagB-type dehydrogenase family enzyme